MRKIKEINCPNCGKDMSYGAIWSTHAINWSEDTRRKFFDFEKEIIVGMPFFKPIKNPAFRCEECKIAIFEYDPFEVSDL
ncbi:PF20097 family protein [Alkaliphilus transvaalensis]|uniref:PF20097 family protein n=1 Tax=Alkaliphilus transvaalensis TaxID=114628 RepID=UPI00047BEEDF|nr:PF20097 family protein [Alkaliphilus transvaalensis]